jgi:hypothetical protein
LIVTPVVDGAAKLKRPDGPELPVHGSSTLIQMLLAASLIDKFPLW